MAQPLIVTIYTHGQNQAAKPRINKSYQEASNYEESE